MRHVGHGRPGSGTPHAGNCWGELLTTVLVAEDDADIRDLIAFRLPGAEPCTRLRHLELRFGSVEGAAYGPYGSSLYPISRSANHSFSGWRKDRASRSFLQP